MADISEPAADSAGAAPAELGYVVDALKGELDQEFAIAERLTTKSRQVFALGGLFFTIIQTVAFNAFLDEEVLGYERWVLLACVGVAVLALVRAAMAAAEADSPIPGHRIPLWLLMTALNAIHTGRVALPPRERRTDAEDLLGTLPEAEEPLERLRFRWFPPADPPDVDRLAIGRHRAFKTREVVESMEQETLTREDAPAYLATYYARLVSSRLRGNERRRRLYVRARSFAAVAIAATTVELLFSLVARLTG